MTVHSPEAQAPSARERLLAAAAELFYAEGVHTVGIDRVIERAGVAKATLYSTFGSKDELVRAYLTERLTARQQWFERLLARYDTPRERLLGVFDALRKSFADPRFRGCAFVNASAEGRPGGAAEEVSDAARRWLNDLFRGLAADVGVADPDALAAQLVLLYDGATVTARMQRDPSAAVTARAMAEVLLDAAG